MVKNGSELSCRPRCRRAMAVGVLSWKLEMDAEAKTFLAKKPVVEEQKFDAKEGIAFLQPAATSSGSAKSSDASPDASLPAPSLDASLAAPVVEASPPPAPAADAPSAGSMPGAGDALAQKKDAAKTAIEALTAADKDKATGVDANGQIQAAKDEGELRTTLTTLSQLPITLDVETIMKTGDP